MTMDRKTRLLERKAKIDAALKDLEARETARKRPELTKGPFL